MLQVSDSMDAEVDVCLRRRPPAAHLSKFVWSRTSISGGSWSSSSGTMAHAPSVQGVEHPGELPDRQLRVIDDERGVTVVVRVVDDQDPEDPPRGIHGSARSLSSIWDLPTGISTAMWS